MLSISMIICWINIFISLEYEAVLRFGSIVKITAETKDYFSSMYMYYIVWVSQLYMYYRIKIKHCCMSFLVTSPSHRGPRKKRKECNKGIKQHVKGIKQHVKV